MEIVDEINRLGEALAGGLITDAEFATLKQRLLNVDDAQAKPTRTFRSWMPWLVIGGIAVSTLGVIAFGAPRGSEETLPPQSTMESLSSDQTTTSESLESTVPSTDDTRESAQEIANRLLVEWVARNQVLFDRFREAFSRLDSDLNGVKDPEVLTQHAIALDSAVSALPDMPLSLPTENEYFLWNVWAGERISSVVKYAIDGDMVNLVYFASLLEDVGKRFDKWLESIPAL